MIALFRVRRRNGEQHVDWNSVETAILRRVPGGPIQRGSLQQSVRVDVAGTNSAPGLASPELLGNFQATRRGRICDRRV